MNEKETKLIIAAILHDIGKVIYREGNDVRKHSISGYDYLKETGITDKEILDAVKYHHAQSLRNADIEDNSLSYIVYMADNIASATDRRERMEEEKGFEISAPLESVFILFRVNCHRPDAEFTARSEYSYCNFASIGHEYSFEVSDFFLFCAHVIPLFL